MLITFLLPLVCLWNLCKGDVLGTPRVECKEDGIQISVNMSSSFSGRVYLKGHSATLGCYQDYSRNRTTHLDPFFSFEKCHPRRKREVVPAGMRMQTRMIISHHPRVETYQDVAFDIDCFYRERDDEVATAVQELRVISDQPPQEMRMEPAPPVCSYRVEIGNTTEKEGEMTSTIAVGDTVTHVWSCDEGDDYHMYCIKVHSCFARAVEGDESISVVDSHGCVLEHELLSSLRHSFTIPRVSATSRVYKFPNSTGIQFECQISYSMRIHEEGAVCPTEQCFSAQKRQKRSVRIEVESQELTVLEDRVAFLAPSKVARCDWFNSPMVIVSTLFLVYFVFTLCLCLSPKRRQTELSMRF